MLPKNYKDIHGWCTVEKANKLIDLVISNKPSLVVELGVFGGKSLLPFALACKINNNNSKVIGIDSWTVDASLEGKNDIENDKWWSKINYNEMQKYTETIMKLNQVDSIVELWKFKSIDVIDKFENNSIDILHQDSNHSEEISTKEVEYYFDKVKHGGFWVFDDINWSTTQKAQQMLLEKGCIEIFVDPLNTWKIFFKPFNY
jgi:predicted O-methyltransferase YrrM